MYRTLWLALTVVGFFGSSTLRSQEVIEKPGTGCWKVRYEEQNEWDKGPRGPLPWGAYKTLGAARQAAADCRRASDALKNVTPKRIYFKVWIEGEDAKSGPPANLVPRTPSLVETVMSGFNDENRKNLAKFHDNLRTQEFVYKLLTDPEKALEDKSKEWESHPGDTIKEYAKSIGEAWDRVKDAKDKILTFDKREAEKALQSVNDAIGKYNKVVEDGNTKFGAGASVFPRFSAAGPESVESVALWKQAIKQQFDLEDRREALDKGKSQLDRERAQLELDWQAVREEVKPFDPGNAKVLRLRDRLDEYKAKVERYTVDLEKYKVDSSALENRIKQLEQKSAMQVSWGNTSASLANSDWVHDRTSEIPDFQFSRDGAFKTRYFGTGKWQQTGKNFSAASEQEYAYCRMTGTIEGDKLIIKMRTKTIATSDTGPQEHTLHRFKK